MINIKNISFNFDNKKIFEDFSLQIKKGDKLWLYGPSGCGKTTLTRLILGLEKAQKGVIETQNLKPSVVFQENRLLPFLSVIENIKLVANNTEKIRENLLALGIADTENLKISELSGGMQRRVAIARALSCEFEFLILDEPFTGLDKGNIESASKQILKIADDKPILLITHSSFEAKLLNAKKISI